MNKTMTDFIRSCSDDDLYSLWEKLINEMNRRKTAEVRKEQEK